MYKTINSTRIGWSWMLCLLLVLLAHLAQAQQVSWGNAMVHGSGSMAVFGAHDFQAGTGTQPGIVKTDRSAPIGIFRFADGASYINEGPGKLIDGYVSKTGTSAFTFPVGDGANAAAGVTKLRPISISAPTAMETFRAAYFFSNPNTATLPANAPFPVANLGTGITGVSTTEFWDLNGSSAVNVTLTWDAASNIGTLTSNTLANLIVVGYNTNTSKWEKLGTSETRTGDLTTGNIVVNGVTPNTYAAVTFGAAQAVTTPDLRPFITMLVSSFSATNITRPFSVRVRNMRDNTTATDPVSIRIYKPTPTATVTLTGASVTEWTIVNSGTFFTLTTNSDIVSGATGNLISASLTIPAAVANGSFQLRAFIPDASGGEIVSDNTNNNVFIVVTKQ